MSGKSIEISGVPITGSLVTGAGFTSATGAGVMSGKSIEISGVPITGSLATGTGFISGIGAGVISGKSIEISGVDITGSLATDSLADIESINSQSSSFSSFSSSSYSIVVILGRSSSEISSKSSEKSSSSDESSSSNESSSSAISVWESVCSGSIVSGIGSCVGVSSCEKSNEKLFSLGASLLTTLSLSGEGITSWDSVSLGCSVTISSNHKSKSNDSTFWVQTCWSWGGFVFVHPIVGFCAHWLEIGSAIWKIIIKIKSIWLYSKISVFSTLLQDSCFSIWQKTILCKIYGIKKKDKQRKSLYFLFFSNQISLFL